MSSGAEKTWLVAYDIRCPRRLRRVRALRREGATVQYSAFAVAANDAGIQRVLDGLLRLIDPRKDDVRAYHIPARCPVWTLGTQAMPEGIMLDADVAARMLSDSAEAPQTSQ